MTLSGFLWECDGTRNHTAHGILLAWSDGLCSIGVKSAAGAAISRSIVVTAAGSAITGPSQALGGDVMVSQPHGACHLAGLGMAVEQWTVRLAPPPRPRDNRGQCFVTTSAVGPM